jgi:hypothetical protein
MASLRLTCQWCSKEFFTFPCRTKKIYCSMRCAAAAKTKTRDEGAGYRRMPNGITPGRPLREHRYVAAVAAGISPFRRFVVHHVDDDRMNNRTDNLVILENPSEHAQLHRRRTIYRAGGNPFDLTIARCHLCKQIVPLDQCVKGTQRCRRCWAEYVMNRKKESVMQSLRIALIVGVSVSLSACTGVSAMPTAPSLAATSAPAVLVTPAVVPPAPAPVVPVVTPAPDPAPVPAAPAPVAPAPPQAPPAPVVAPPPPLVNQAPPPPPDGPCGKMACTPPPQPPTCPPGTHAELKGDAPYCAVDTPPQGCPPGTHPELGETVTCEVNR